MNAINHECTMHEPCMHGLVEKHSAVLVSYAYVCEEYKLKTIPDSQ